MRLTHAVGAFVLLTAGLALVPTAQAQQEVRVQLNAEGPVTQPVDLPGTYVWYLEVESEAPAGVCACTELLTHLHLRGVPEDARAHLLPSFHRLDWLVPTGSATSSSGALVVELPEHFTGTPAFRITVDGTAETDTPTTSAEVLPTQVVVQPPVEHDQPAPTTQTGSGDEDDGTSHVWGAGLATAAAGLGLVATRIRRS